MTDISSYLPLFSIGMKKKKNGSKKKKKKIFTWKGGSNYCEFQLQTDSYILKPWKANLNIIFEWDQPLYESSEEFSLFQGGTFDKNYNKKYSPILFNFPTPAKKVKIVAVITGKKKNSLK